MTDATRATVVLLRLGAHWRRATRLREQRRCPKRYKILETNKKYDGKATANKGVDKGFRLMLDMARNGGEQVNGLAVWKPDGDNATAMATARARASGISKSQRLAHKQGEPLMQHKN